MQIMMQIFAFHMSNLTTLDRGKGICQSDRNRFGSSIPITDALMHHQQFIVYLTNIMQNVLVDGLLIQRGIQQLVV